MGFVIFIVYLVVCCWLVTRIAFFKKSGIGKPLLVVLFICKVAAGITYAWFYSLPQYISGSDTWRFFEASKAETDMLFKNPWAFVTDIFHHGYNNGAGNIFHGENSYWNDLKSNVVIKLMAVCNALTLRHYYSNIILFNFVFLFGPVAFYRVMQPSFPEKKWLLIITVFLLPSFLFWCSGIHKDGLIFLTLALVIFYFNQLLGSGKLRAAQLLMLFCSLAVLFALRNIICLLLLPALLTWFLCHRYPNRRLVVIGAVYGACLIIFFLTPYISQSVNLPAYAADKQHEFMQLQGGSQIKVPPLQPTFIGFARFLPNALDIALLRPHMAEVHNASYLPAILELFLLWFLIGLFILSKKNYPQNGGHIAIIVFCFCFALSYLLLSGYTVTFSGAIVRYKSIVLPLMFCPLVCITNISKQNTFLTSSAP